jgi:hypothetical protein
MKHLLFFLLLCPALLAQPNDRRDRPDNRADRRPPRVILFEHADYQGDFIVLSPGDTFENLSGKSFPHGARLNDGISSIRVEGGAELYAYADARFRGPALRVTDNIRDLSGRLVPDAARSNWNDRISSLRVEFERRPGGREPEPDVVIRRVFQEILLREPTPQDLRYFRGLVIEQNWTERMVRDQLRQWEEYRHEGADRVIRRAYRDVLGREPDSRELQACRRNLLEKEWNEGDLCDDLRRSDEYRKHGGGRR